MKQFMLALAVLILINSNAWALVKPIDVRDYDTTYEGVYDPSNPDALDYWGSNGPGTLYRDNYCYPCPSGEGRGGHVAVDVPCMITPVYAIASGIIERAGWDDRGFGYTIVVKHTSEDISGLTFPQDIVYACYSHLSSISVIVGNSVYEGQPIGATGNSGPSTWHLHFQIDRHRRLDNREIISMNNTNISSNMHPFLPNNYLEIVNLPDETHDMENYTINPMPFLMDMDGGIPCYIPVGFATSEDYEENPHWGSGLSQEFRERYDAHIFNDNNGDPNGIPQDTPQRGAIGFPWDNSPEWLDWGQAVHKVEDMWIQDFYGPHNGFNLPYCALIKGENEDDPVCLLKDGFWDYWINNGGWVDFGYPVTDEYPSGGDPHQTFRKGEWTVVFAWENGEVDVEYLSGISVNMYNITFTTNIVVPRSIDDGIYHSNWPVTDFDMSIEMVEGRTYDGFYAMIGQEQIWIDPFTVNGDMTIVVESDDGRPIASFRGDPVIGSTPLTVYFSDESIGDGIEWWYWQFGDGATSTDRHPNHVYEQPGIYTVSLLVSTPQYSDYVERVDYITVVEPVQAIGDFEIINPWAPDAEVQFTNLSTGGHGQMQVLWNFDDGNTSTEHNPSHIYTIAGDYVVRLDVSDAYSSDFTYLPLHIAEHVVPDFVADVTTGIAPLTVQFTDLSVGNPNWWDWDYGDAVGLCCIEANPIHTYEMPGVYSVSLDVANDDESGYITKTNYITVTDSSGCDGNGAYHFNGIDQYVSVGTLVGGVLGSECTVEGWLRLDRNDVEQNIYSYWNVAQFKMFNLYVDNTGHFVGSRHGEVPSTAFGNTILQLGEWYYLAMVAKDGEETKVYVNGHLDGIANTVLDTPNSTSALLGSMAMQNYDGMHINHLKGSLDEWRVSSIARTEEEIAANYASGLEMEIDEYTLPLWHMNGVAGTDAKQLDANGLRNLDERWNPQAVSGFNECVPPVANFVAELVSGAAPLTVQFTDLSFGSMSWNWVFGDGNTSIEQNPEHTYTETGVYTVSLLVSNSYGSDDMIREDYITVESAVAVPEDSLGAFALHHNHPNPFNPTTLITYKVKDTCHVRLVVHDLAGRFITTLVDQVVQPGINQVIFNGSGLSSGVYFYKLETPAGAWTHKMTLVK